MTAEPPVEASGSTIPGRVGGPRRRPIAAILVAVAIVALAASVVLPWWSESESYGGSVWVQTYSPIFGVHGSCSPGCGAFDEGPPFGPVSGTESFSTLGLNRTAELYTASLVLLFAALALAAAGIATGLASTQSARIDRGQRFCVAAAALSAGASGALLAALQPDALRADTIGRFSGGSTWTASPSPETSFLGGCARGVDQGLCASGGSAVWGPSYGWILVVAGTALLAVAFVKLSRRGSSRSPGPRSEDGSTGAEAASPGTPG
jgi:hypothetical protein